MIEKLNLQPTPPTFLHNNIQSQKPQKMVTNMYMLISEHHLHYILHIKLHRHFFTSSIQHNNSYIDITTNTPLFKMH